MAAFPGTPTIGQIYSDATAGASWVWSGTEWNQVSPTDIHPWAADAAYAPGDLIFYPATNAPGITRAYINSSGGFINAFTPFDYASWTPVFGGFMRGWFDPTAASGGDVGVWVPEPVKDGQAGYFKGDYLVSLGTGQFNFTTGQPDPAGATVAPGMRIIYSGATWTAEAGPNEAFRGYFDPLVANGGPGVPFPVINGTDDYANGTFLFANNIGKYNFTTGQPDLALGVQVESGAIVTYDGAVWTVLETQPSKNKGFFDPTKASGQPPAPFAVIDGTLEYSENEYLIVTDTQFYNFATGAPVPGGPAAGRTIEVATGGRVIRGPDPAREWFYLPSVTDIYKGSFYPTINGGGPSLDFVLVNGSTDWESRSAVLAVTSGWYQFGSGTTGAGAGAVWVRAGETVTYDGASWTQRIRDDADYRGSFNPTVANGGMEPVIVDGTTNYKDGEFIVARINGYYHFDTATPGAGGTEVTAGDIIFYNGTNWIVTQWNPDGLVIEWTPDTDFRAGQLVWAPAPSDAIYRIPTAYHSSLDFNTDRAAMSVMPISGHLYLNDVLKGGYTQQKLAEQLLYIDESVATTERRTPTDDNEIVPKWYNDRGKDKVYEDVTIPGHSFSTGDAIYTDGTIWHAAIANNIDTLRKGIVGAVDGDTFEVVYNGVIPWTHGKNALDTYWLSDVNAGQSSTIAPTAIGSFKQIAYMTEGANRIRVIEEAVLRNAITNRP